MPVGKRILNTDFRLEHVQMRDGFCARSRKASESVPGGTVRMTDTEMAQKTPADVHGLGENQYYISLRNIA